jgi:hypothetical protein
MVRAGLARPAAGPLRLVSATPRNFEISAGSTRFLPRCGLGAVVKHWLGDTGFPAEYGGYVADKPFS